MNKNLNLIGIKQLRLVEDVETTKEINTTWLAQQLANAGFTLKKSGEKEIKIFYKTIVLKSKYVIIKLNERFIPRFSTN